MNRLQLDVNGRGSAKVTSQKDLDDVLETFKSQISEAVLIDGREYHLSLSFSAWEENDYNESERSELANG